MVKHNHKITNNMKHQRMANSVVVNPDRDLAEASSGFPSAFNNGLTESMANQLCNLQLQKAQRRDLVANIAHVHGNKYLQREIAIVKSEVNFSDKTTKSSQFGRVLRPLTPTITTIQRWALPDERVMAQIHSVELIDAFRAYAQEAAAPTPDWPSRRLAIQQAIRDRLNILARSGQAEQIDDLTNQVAGMPELTRTDDWLERVLRYHRGRIEVVNTGAGATPVAQADPEILAAASAAVSAGTLTVAVYIVPRKTIIDPQTGQRKLKIEREFRTAAREFAKDHRALGFHNGRLIVGEEAAIHVESTQDVVDAVNNTRAEVRLLLSRPDARVNTLALFAHGVNASRLTGGRSYLNLTGGHQITNVQQFGYDPPGQEPVAPDQLRIADFANRIEASLSRSARVVLYACELGDAFQGGEGGHSLYQDWTAAQQGQARQGALADELARGDTSFADELRDLLNATGSKREVWGHRTTGHTSRNPTWRQYGSGTQAGAENLFGEESAESNLTAQEGWELKKHNLALASSVVNELRDRLRVSLPPRTLQRLENRAIKKVKGVQRRIGLAGWIARELPFAPTPFVEGDPPVVRDEVVQFLERQAILHESPAQ